MLLLAATGCLRTRTRFVTPIDTMPAHAPQAFTEPDASRREAEGPTAMRMRNVDFHVAPDVVLRVRSLSGELRSVVDGEPVLFDDKRSFEIHIASGDAGLRAPDLARLLNGYVFAYAGAPLTDLRVSFVGTSLRLRGTLHKGPDLPFDIVGTLTATAAGEIRVRPTSIKLAKIPAGPLLKLVGLRLDRVLDLRGSHGARVSRNDILLLPDSMLPPPHIRGHLTGVRVVDDEVRLAFDDAALAPSARAAASPPDTSSNFLYFRRGTLRFGKLYMVHADLELIDTTPDDAMDFSLDEYARQLTAGTERVTPARGLLVRIPDLRSLPPAP